MSKPKPPLDMTGDYTNLVDLFAIVSECTNRIKAMEADLHGEYLEAVDARRKEHAELQEKLIKAEQAIEFIARRHPEWFETRRSIKTAYGSVNFRKSTKLIVPNEEVSILLIQQADDEELEKKLLRVDTRLNLEALEKLTDAQLAGYRITRVPDDNFSIKPSTIDLGKAIKQDAEKEAA